MEASQRRALFYGVLAALLWSPHFYVADSLRRGGVPLLVAHFHLVFWPALLLILWLLASGRASALLAFRGQETHLLAVAAAGGYGFWILRAVALDSGGPSHARMLFYCAPLLMGLLSVFSSERAGRRLILALLLGFAGCAMIAEAQGKGAGGAGFAAGSALAGLGAAACWALFSVLARPLVREDAVLPVATLVTGIGALCLLVSCLSMGESVFGFHIITPAQLRTLILTGVFTVGLMMVCWLKCLSSLSAAQAGPVWYLGLLFGMPWALIGGWHISPWWTLVGAVLVLAGLRHALKDRQHSATTLADIIRG